MEQMGFCAVPVVEDEINTHLPSSKSIFTVRSGIWMRQARSTMLSLAWSKKHMRGPRKPNTVCVYSHVQPLYFVCGLPNVLYIFFSNPNTDPALSVPKFPIHFLNLIKNHLHREYNRQTTKSRSFSVFFLKNVSPSEASSHTCHHP